MKMKEKNTVIFADNASFHFGQKVMDTYKKYKCKVLFNTPYLSEFNCIELLFRYIKNIYYKHLYNSIEQLEEHVRSIIDNINEKTISSLFIETLTQYIRYFNKNSNINLN